MSEPLCIDDDKRYQLFPIIHEDAYKLYKKHLNFHWVPDEIDYSDDYSDFERLSEGEKHYLLSVHAFFANSDNIVLENLALNLSKVVKSPEFRMFFADQASREVIHTIVYNEIIMLLTQNDKKLQYELFSAIEHNPIVKPKLDWAKKWAHSDISLDQMFVVWAFVEGVLFSSSFAGIFWFRKRGLLKGISQANQLIFRDEFAHWTFSCLGRNKTRNKISTKQVHEIFREGVKLEHDFVDGCLPEDLQGMNADLMKTYVCHVADTVLEKLGEPKLYNVSNPFPFMESFFSQGKTNFFESRVTEYQKIGNETKYRSEKMPGLSDLGTFCEDDDL